MPLQTRQTSHFLDRANADMSLCTTQWAQAMDRLEKKPIAWATRRLISPLGAVSLAVDSSLHIALSVLKTLYSLLTGSIELAVNAFHSKRWKPINPLGVQKWNRWEAARHPVQAVSCFGVALLSLPLGIVKPDWPLRLIRYFQLAAPKAIEKAEKPKETALWTTIKKVGAAIANCALLPIDLFNEAFRRFPYVFELTKCSIIAIGAGVSAHYAPQILHKLGLDSIL